MTGALSGKAGPVFSPVPFEKQLENAVTYATEERLQRMCVRPGEILPEYARALVHADLEKVVSR